MVNSYVVMVAAIELFELGVECLGLLDKLVISANSTLSLAVISEKETIYSFLRL